MKILYALQGTGNGHATRAREIIPILRKEHSVDVLISGTQCDIELAGTVKYKLNGLSFIFGKKGGVDIFETYKKSNLRKLFTEINSLPIEEYDLVLNDFEPVSAWACQFKNKPCISISHQSAVLESSAPRPKSIDIIGKAVLKKYAPTTAQYGFHFQPYNKNIFTPVIREEVRNYPVENKRHYTVYLPAYDDKRIIKILQEFPSVMWEVFSKHNRKVIEGKHITIRPINNDAFIKSMATGSGVLCGAGFETPAEALFLKKKLLVIPMKGQFEQQCNAAALKKMGVPVIKSFKKKHIDKIKVWLKSTSRVIVEYPDHTAEILSKIVTDHTPIKKDTVLVPWKKAYTLKDFRDMSLKKIMKQLEA
jgi:uncharacterized protein (TIGR00661 family)